MRIGREGAVGALVVVALSGCRGADAGWAAGFERLEYENAPGLGFCVGEGQLLDMSITRGDDGALTVAGALVHEAVAEPEDCYYYSARGEPCIVRAPFEPFLLDAERSAELDALVERLPPRICQPTESESHCDPCVIPMLAIDGESASPRCDGSLVGTFWEHVHELIAYIYGLSPTE